MLPLVLLSLCATDGPDGDDEADASELESAFLAIDAAQVCSAVAGFKGDAKNILADPSINRWTEKRSGKSGKGEEALGEQEVRGLLHKVGAGGDGPRAFFIRGQLAPAIIKLLDGNGDGRLSEAELQAALSIAECGGVLSSCQLPTIDTGDAAHTTLDRFLSALRSCNGAKQLWALWAERADGVEAALPALRLPASSCETELVGQVLPHGEPADRSKLRATLKRLGVAPFGARHLVATALLLLADEDGDGRLSAGEAAPHASAVCLAAADLLQLGTSAAHGLSKILLEGTWSFAQTAAVARGQVEPDVLGTSDVLRHAAEQLQKPLHSLGQLQGMAVGAAFVKHATAAYAAAARRKEEL